MSLNYRLRFLSYVPKLGVYRYNKMSLLILGYENYFYYILNGNIRSRDLFYLLMSLQINLKVLYHGLEFALGIIDILVVILLLYCYYEYVQNFGERNLKEKVGLVKVTLVNSV